jgi:Na+/melibiose symporter-like transporter
MTTATPAPHRVPVFTKIFFGVGEFATATKGYAMAAFLLFYYTQVLGLDGWLTGLALGIAIVFDAVNDPVVGSISDNWRSRLGRRHPLMWISALPMCISFYYLWVPPEGLGQYELFGWLTAFSILARSCMTLFQIPHNALGAELSPDYSERSRIWAYAHLFGWLGGGSFGLFAYTRVFRATPEFENGLLNPSVYPDLAMLGVVYIFVGIMFSTALTQRAARALPEQPPPKEKFSFKRLYREVRQALQNRNFKVLFFGILLSGALHGVASTLGLHMQTYFWGLLPAQIMYFIFAGFTVNLLAFGIVQALAARYEKKKLLIGLSIFATVDSITVISARLMGWLPENGDPWLLPIIVTTYGLGTGAGAIVSIVARAMIADVVDEQELVTGERQEGMFYSAVAFSGKAVSGIGAMTGGLLLSIIQFPANVDATTVPPDVIFRMGIFMGPMMGVLYLVPILIYLLYRLDRHRHFEIREQLTRLRHSRLEDATEPLQSSVAAGGGR